MRWPRRRSGRSARALRLFFATDLHGSEVCFRKFLAAARVYEADVLVLGGDLTGKSVVPLVRNGWGAAVGTAAGARRLESRADVAEYAGLVADHGSYCVHVERDEAEVLEADERALDRALVREARTRAESWVALAEERLAELGTPCYVTGGNDDPDEVLAAFRDGGAEHVRFCDGDVVEIGDGLEMLSVGFSNPTPWATPREVPDDDLRTLIESVAAKVGDPRSALFNIHPPPADTGLGRCPKLDTSTDPPSPVRIAGELVYTDAGSEAVRQALLEHQPLAGLHGHIHEARGAARLGSTVALNPGSTYAEGILRGVIVAVRGSRVVHQFTSG